MRSRHKLILCFVTVVLLFVVFYRLNYDTENSRKSDMYENHEIVLSEKEENFIPLTYPHTNNRTVANYVNVWVIFTKATNNSPLKFKFNNFLSSSLDHASVNIALHIITDNKSKNIAEEIVKNCETSYKLYLKVTYYNVNHFASRLSDVISAMQPHFSSQPGTYYSDALFFLSLGLHRIVTDQSRIIIFDADTKLLGDIAELHQHFDNFGDEALFGLAPELTPVYRHVLYVYRSKHKNTTFGNPASRGGFPGVNSGVLLMDLDKMRNSEKYHMLLHPASVDKLASKYNFKGHLGDQDFYTLLAMEYPELVHILPCNWNRQLCTWWRDHGYRDVFDDFYRCDGPIKLYHGNCNTPIPTK